MGKMTCISYKKSTTPATQPMRSHHYSKLLFLCNGLLFKTIPPNSSLFSIKIMLFPLGLLDSPVVFTTAC